ncbi:MAG TPA: PA14 domain-containing protein, partial [Polyangia bacterium]
GSDTNPGGTIDAGSDGATPMADANVPFDASLNDQRSDATMPPDVSSPVDGPAPMPDVAADMRPVMDTSSPPPDMASPPDVMPPPPDVSTAPDAVQSMVNGLRGEYHNGQNFETPVFTRIDQVINFSWVKTSPDPRIGEDNFSVRWTGYIEPRYTDTYTISTLTDDGARLWIDGVVYIDKWSTQSGIEHSAVVNLVANRRYAIRMEFFDRAFTGSAQLFWRSSQQAKEIIPYTRLWTP